VSADLADAARTPDLAASRFAAYCWRREEAAVRAVLPGYATIATGDVAGMVACGNPWSRALFDGDFYRTPTSTTAPSVGLVFVRSRDGNTVAANPSLLGGGATDLHLIYEGLSRVDADGVLSGATTVAARDIVLSVWHPELVALRLARGKPRHPRQIVVTARGELRLDDGLMFQMSQVPVTLITTTGTAPRLRVQVRNRPWIDVIDAGEPISLQAALEGLRQRGVAVISAIGGPKTATALLQERLISDLYLTTSPIEAGEPDTPYCAQPPADARLRVAKAGRGNEAGVVFEHLTVIREP
jgi:5-amino-6-(5-phosphoribosylamino)uracil reductase